MKGNFHARFLGGCGRVNRPHLPGTMPHMSAEDITCWRNLAIVVGIIAVLQFLCLVACREVVKTDLRQRCCEPISVRFLWWRSLLSARLGIPWRVVYSDFSRRNASGDLPGALGPPNDVGQRRDNW